MIVEGFSFESIFNLEAKNYAVKLNDNCLVFLAFGFHHGIGEPEHLCRHSVLNHKSVLDFPAQVTRFLDMEVTEGAIARTFAGLPLPQYQISPLMSRFKGNCARYIIFDLSFGEKSSVNGYIPQGVYDSSPYNPTLPYLYCLI